MYKLSSFLLSSLLSLLARGADAPNAVSKTFDLSTQESKVEFFAVGKPSMLKINGVGGKLAGTIELAGMHAKGDFIVPLELITTGISLRDEHMKTKYLETKKFPEAVLKISKIKFDKDYLKESGSQKDVPFSGKLNIHGNESDVTGLADIESDGKGISFKASTTTSIAAHKIELPTYLGVKVADEITLKVDLKIKK